MTKDDQQDIAQRTVEKIRETVLRKADEMTALAKAQGWEGFFLWVVEEPVVFENGRANTLQYTVHASRQHPEMPIERLVSAVMHYAVGNAS